MNSFSSPRSVAAQVLQRVLFDDAYAAAALSSALERESLAPRDRGLCTELVYGVVRTQPYLMRRLSRFGKIKQSDQVLCPHLYVATYQLLFLDRVPPHAAVDEAVGALRRTRGPRVAGFCNAILRKLAQEAERERPTLQQAIFESTPSWLRKRLVRDVGEEEAVSLLVPGQSPQPFLRFAKGAQLPSWVESGCSPVIGAPQVFRFVAGGDPRRREEYQQGHFAVQELGACVVGYSVGASYGERVLDVCAGRGQKTMILSEAVGAEGLVVATDLHEHKVRALAEESQRMGASIDAKVWDWTQAPPAEWNQAFDRVLVDAPCTGVGTLRRRPEIARHLSHESPLKLAELQKQIVENALLALKIGGTMTFATCSVLQIEGPELVQALIESGRFRLFSPPSAVDEFLAQGQSEVPAQLHLLPGRHGTDGYFVARLTRLR